MIMLNRILIVTCLLLLLTINSFSQMQSKVENSGKQTLAELTKITSEVYEAGTSGDKSVLEKYLADSFLELDATGVLRDKAWHLANFLPATDKFTFTVEEAQIRQYDRTTILYYKWVTLHQRISPPKDEKAKTEITGVAAKLRVIHTFVKTEKGWQLVSSSRIRLRNE